MMKKEHYDTWVFAREGHKALHDKVLPYITRDISKLEVGDLIIGDGHKLAFQVINPYTGNPTRATMVAYQEWKSGAMVGFEIMLEENKQCVASALRNATQEEKDWIKEFKDSKAYKDIYEDEEAV